MLPAAASASAVSSAGSPAPFDQGRYQVRFEWGAAGLERLAAADVVVVVDVLVTTDEASAIASASDALVLRGGLRNAGAVADAVLAEQGRRGARTSIAVIGAGAGERTGLRFAVEDLLGAGAVIDALSSRGIDHTSPEAAAACESFRGLRGAVRHLLTASATGQELAAAGRRDEALAAAEIDADTAVPVLRRRPAAPPA
ncbi:2-phosphosulfolactate phosphatase [Microbacterium radiodurans]|uniref:Probable 2-phosphosulfolactate phosphatase n=1 Tax=Microbacterium radiodurans TaxID=661398 RepID=A0A5J5IUE9_9MICO|nr:2-phosphosulfolactate phosphatase [Microbacterium radiodurans]KAA9089016.1 2-phosphosulfolactate phosphatase [Microbacterium radiodurans]